MPGCRTFPPPAGVLTPLFSCAGFTPATDANADPSGFCSRAVDRLIARAEATQAQNPAAATELWQRAERAILAQAPVVPLYNADDVTRSSRIGSATSRTTRYRACFSTSSG
jgi:peptide/nickel transport system substrate-binding protein